MTGTPRWIVDFRAEGMSDDEITAVRRGIEIAVASAGDDRMTDTAWLDELDPTVTVIPFSAEAPALAMEIARRQHERASWWARWRTGRAYRQAIRSFRLAMHQAGFEGAHP